MDAYDTTWQPKKRYATWKVLRSIYGYGVGNEPTSRGGGAMQGHNKRSVTAAAPTRQIWNGMGRYREVQRV